MSAVTSDDGLSDDVWDILRAGLTAAHEGRRTDFRDAGVALANRVPFDAQAGVYLWFMLRARVARIVGHRPAAEELREIAERAYPKYSLISVYDVNFFEDILTSVFDLAPEGRPVSDAELTIGSMLALGILMDDPVSDMEVMRPHLAAWWQRNLEGFRARGMLEDWSKAGRRHQ